MANLNFFSRKNLLIFLTVFICLFAVFPVSAETFEGVENPIKAKSFTELINAIADFLLDIGMALATLMILYGGFQYITSGGDTKKIETARQTLTWAVVGLIILLVGKGLTSAIEEVITGETSSDNVVMSAIENITQYFYRLVLAISVIMMIYAGFSFMTAGGDSEKLATAKKFLTYAIVGVVIAILAFSVSAVVESIF